MVRTLQLTGRTFGRLIVLERHSSRHGKAQWLCLCQCGAQTVAPTDRLTSGRVTSCGCYRKEHMSKVSVQHSTTHGQNTTTYKSGAWYSWHAMKQRCLDPNHKSYPRYGGRGITICPEWLVFENFYRDMGDRPEGTTIDRVNNSKGYYPGNCRWATLSQQQRNKG